MIFSRVLARTKEVDVQVLAMLVEVLLLSNVENWRSQIFELSGSFRHLKFLLDLHDFFKLR